MKISLERENLIILIKESLKLNIDNCYFMRKLYKNSENAVKVFTKSIQQSKKAMLKVEKIKHIEILRAIYGDIIGQLSGQLMLGGTLICSKQLEKWDKNEKSFQEFLELQKENAKIYAEKIKEKQESMEIMKKAKEQGKKIEMMVDPITKKVKPVVVENSNEA